jgi:hypothetical protein
MPASGFSVVRRLVGNMIVGVDDEAFRDMPSPAV